MTAAHQLELGAIGSPKRKKEPATRFTCRCGHVRDDHANRMHSGACTICRVDCKRFRPKSKPPVEQPAHLAPPNGAIILERDDTKNAKVMGWAIAKPMGPAGVDAFNGVGEVNGLHAIIYLAQLRTKTPNESWFGGADKLSPKQIRGRFAAHKSYKDTHKERTASAIAQLGVDVVARGRPSALRFTRVASGRGLDGVDNLRGAFKWIIDSVAESLGFNDAELAGSASRAGTIPCDFAQEKAPRGVRGVRIEITWRTT